MCDGLTDFGIGCVLFIYTGYFKPTQSSLPLVLPLIYIVSVSCFFSVFLVRTSFPSDGLCQ